MNQADRVKKWRKNTKTRIIQAMGGGCAICKYSKCQSALALHHLDPSKKDFSFGAIRSSPKSWSKIVLELKKCVMLCHNCHSEVHEGITEIPENYEKFNVSFTNYKSIFDLKLCLICNATTDSNNKYCSIKCRSKSREKIDWTKINLDEEIKSKSISRLARELGVSTTTIRRKLL